MTTSQNRQPKGITVCGQFSATPHSESTLLLDPAQRPVHLTPGDSENFPELADGDVIETLTVSRSHDEDGAGYWVSPSKTLNIKDLIADSDPRLHRDALDRWLDKNQLVIDHFLTSRYEANVSFEDGSWDEVEVECSTRILNGALSVPLAATSSATTGQTRRD